MPQEQQRTVRREPVDSNSIRCILAVALNNRWCASRAPGGTCEADSRSRVANRSADGDGLVDREPIAWYAGSIVERRALGITDVRRLEVVHSVDAETGGLATDSLVPRRRRLGSPSRDAASEQIGPTIRTRTVTQRQVRDVGQSLVLPVRIERTTSPFITLTLSRPPSGVCVLDHPFAIGPREPVGAARLASTPSRRVGLGSGLPSACPDGFPEFERCTTRSFPSGWAIYQGSALPLSYGSIPPNLPRLLSGQRAPPY